MKKKSNKPLKRTIPLRNSGEIIQPERPSKTLFDEVARQLKAESETEFFPNPEPSLSPNQYEIVRDGTRQVKSNQDYLSGNKTVQDSTRQVKRLETSPTRNFSKVHNTLITNAIPEGYFRGLSKHTYDVLFHRTRGAIIPTRTIQLTKDELAKLTGLSIQAVKLHIKYLKDCGLIMNRPTIGKHSGWIYEVFTYDEIKDTEQDSTRQAKANQAYSSLTKGDHDQTRQDKTKQDKTSSNLVLETIQNLDRLGYSKLTGNKEDNESLNTLFNTNTVDDEFTGTLNEYCVKATGRDLTESDKSQLAEFAKIIGGEILMARSRTKNISAFVPFMISHFKGLIGGEKIKKGSGIKRDKVGEPTNEINLENELLIMRDLAELEGIEAIEKWKNNYSAENWKYLMKNLEK